MNLGYKMLVLDMDDTLLTDDHIISEKNKEMLLKAQDEGVMVVLASGRPTPAMLSFARELELDRYGSYIISYNGGTLIDMADESVVYSQSLSVKNIHDLYDFASHNGVDIITYSSDSIYSESHSKYIQVEIDITKMHFDQVADFKKAVDFDGVKCIMLEEPSKLQEVKPLLEEAFPELSISFSKPFFLEVTQTGIDKAATLARLSEITGIKQEQIIAVGNAGNDLSMVEYAGLGVWVDNVTPELRHKADVIVASNNDDGVAEVVEKFLLKKEMQLEEM
ncbi:Cof-type HAD-IIB family hydrolase [Flammeovirga sp. MY04]|uniref:Cof-type HAD-IIB family hydrolase n=1 Tax=Flammeovirga sp. MY04 TaxID=1191459 RepID=UPI0008060D5E|nr:Cof-type HAD-IIB family hydrolase [Flammeovirga sp. MY04]ANQ49555.1 Cof-type HAD-IIB family hydrolase [Flammeovirga sp. MY04]